MFTCPLPAALTAITPQTCPFRFDQIVRIAFQRRQPAGTPPFATLAALQTLASWTPLVGAADNTKIVMSPIFSSLVIPASEGNITGGGDNTTFNGIPDYNGENPVTVTGVFKDMAPIVMRELETYSAESLAGTVGVSNLTVFMINKDGYTFQENPVTGAGAATTNYRGIPIYNFRISSPGSEGLNARNVNNFSFTLLPKWAHYLSSVKPTFDPLTEL